jgi:lysozyme family protein
MERPPHELAIGKFILDAEARRDTNGRLAVYMLPKSDGGGTFEVAGINDRYHPQAAANLSQLISRRKFTEAEREATEYILKFTDPAGSWARSPSTEAVLRDTAFNRGVTGCARILQMALGAEVDGKVGPLTLASLQRAEREPRAFLLRFREAREAYEMKVAPPVGNRAKFWKGLVSRWNQTTKFANTLV